MAKVLAWYFQQPSADANAVAPWTDVPQQLRQSNFGWNTQWENDALRLHTVSPPFPNEDALGIFIETGIHNNFLHSATAAWSGEAIIGNLHSPQSTYFYQIHGLVDLWWSQAGVVVNDEAKWITALYADLLGRAPDSAGLNGWVAARVAGGSIESIVNGFLNSSEYCGNLATSFYATFLGRAPDPEGLQSWTSQLMAGTARQDIQLGFLDSAEYTGINPPPAQFVESLYQRLLNRASEPTGKQAWIDSLAAGATAADIIRGFLFSQEYCAQRVTELYRGLLGRTPESAGLAGWVGQLSGGASFQAIQNGFLASPEYRARALTRF